MQQLKASGAGGCLRKGRAVRKPPEYREILHLREGSRRRRYLQGERAQTKKQQRKGIESSPSFIPKRHNVPNHLSLPATRLCKEGSRSLEGMVSVDQLLTSSTFGSSSNY
jgi:hypothetical protein